MGEWEMSEKKAPPPHTETLERYCHVIGRNTLVQCVTQKGGVTYACVNRKECDRCGGCRHDRYCGGVND